MSKITKVFAYALFTMSLFGVGQCMAAEENPYMSFSPDELSFEVSMMPLGKNIKPCDTKTISIFCKKVKKVSQAADTKLPVADKVFKTLAERGAWCDAEAIFKPAE